MLRALRLLAILLWLGLGAGAQAHEVRPGYLELQQTGLETWDVIWKVPARGDLQLGIAPAWPENCDVQEEPRRFTTGGAATEHSAIRCAGGLTGREVGVSALTATVIDVLVRLQRSDGTTQVVRLTPSAPAFLVEAAPRWTAIASTYLGLGVEHILLGIDHLLFVLAMLLLVRSGGRLVATITAFTVAHSITLAAATLGFVHVPPQPVEAAIALSIVFVAVEIVHGRMGRPGLAERWPWVVAFAFGLLHGLGFAGALREVGLPENAIPSALLFFNVGVELGQLAFVGAVLAVLASVRYLRISRRRGAGASRPTASGRWRCTGLSSASSRLRRDTGAVRLRFGTFFSSRSAPVGTPQNADLSAHLPNHWDGLRSPFRPYPVSLGPFSPRQPNHRHSGTDVDT